MISIRPKLHLRISDITRYIFQFEIIFFFFIFFFRKFKKQKQEIIQQNGTTNQGSKENEELQDYSIDNATSRIDWGNSWNRTDRPPSSDVRHRHHQLPSALALALLALLALVCVDLLYWIQQLQAELLSNQPTRSVYRANGTTVDHLVYMRSRSHVATCIRSLLFKRNALQKVFSIPTCQLY